MSIDALFCTRTWPGSELPDFMVAKVRPFNFLAAFAYVGTGLWLGLGTTPLPQMLPARSFFSSNDSITGPRPHLF